MNKIFKGLLEKLKSKEGFLGKSVWTTSSTLAFAIFSLACNKLFSIFFGPQGVTLLAHFQNLVSLFTLQTNEGINKAMIRFYADSERDNVQWQKYFFASAVLTIASCLVTALLVFFGFGFFDKDFPPGFFSPINIFLISLGTFLHVITLFFFNLFLAKAEFKIFSILSILNNLLGIGIVGFGLTKGLNTALVCLSFSPSLMLTLAYYFFYRSNFHRFLHFQFVFDKKIIDEILKFIFVALSGIVFGKLVDFFVRSYSIEHFQMYETGLWQGAVKISDGYSTLLTAAFGMLFFVKISSLANKPNELKVFIRKAFLGMMFITFIGLGLVWIFRFTLLTLLYDQEFTKASGYLELQLLADVFKFPSYILGYLLTAQLRLNMFVLTQLFSIAVYVILIYIISPTLGIYGLPVSNAIRFFLYLLLNIFLTRKTLF